ncbi:MAG: aminoglycoside phosphotransferase family protein [Chloroflexota bacterium]|nr:aminoglycoside phosphotransferase family protein [Chloroflexota bacterium]
MIPVPPFDRGLPGLATAFNGDIVAELLEAHLPDRSAGRFVIFTCRPHYVRYKPDTSCLVEYELTLRDRESNRTLTLPAHLRLYADDRGALRWQSDSLRRLIERTEQEHPGFPRDRVTYLPAMRGLVQVFPVDLDLRKLVRATSPAVLQRVLPEALPESSGEPTDEPPTVVRYKPGRKALLRIPMTAGIANMVYAKLLSDDRGAIIRDAGVTLRDAGIATPAPLAYLADYRMLVHAAAPGEPLAALRRTAAFTTWMEPAAHALARFQATDVPGLSTHPLSAEMDLLTATATAIGRLLPDVAPRVQAVAAGIGNRLAAIQELPATSHGDFYDDQLLVSAADVILIDLDDARCAHPLLDAGNMLAHLTLAADRGDVPAEAGEAFAGAYLRRYPANQVAIAAFEAAALLKLAVGPFRRLEPDWPVAVEHIIHLAEQRLAPGRHRAPAGPETNIRNAGPLDPKLPQLAVLTDPRRMAIVLERAVYGRLVSVSNIDVVRHKPGRRAILRYEVVTDDQEAPRRERLYGKTFASERGPRAFRTATAIAHASGLEIRVPEPVAYVPNLKLMLQRDVAGQPVASPLLHGDERLAERIATALHTFHGSGVSLERDHDQAREFDPLRVSVERLATIDPALGASARRCLDLVQQGRHRAWLWRRRPIHRDFYHDQVLIDGDHLGFLDFDDAAISEPAIDVANFAAHLRLLAIQQGDDPAALAAVTAAFRRCYHALDPDLDPVLTRFLEGATLLRLADIHAPRDDGTRIAVTLLRESEHELQMSLADPPAPGFRDPGEHGDRHRRFRSDRLTRLLVRCASRLDRLSTWSVGSPRTSPRL